MTEDIYKEIGKLVVREVLAPFIKALRQEFRDEGHTDDSFKAWEKWLRTKGIDLDKVMPPAVKRILDEVTQKTDDLGGGRA